MGDLDGRNKKVGRSTQDNSRDPSIGFWLLCDTLLDTAALPLLSDVAREPLLSLPIPSSRISGAPCILRPESLRHLSHRFKIPLPNLRVPPSPSPLAPRVKTKTRGRTPAPLPSPIRDSILNLSRLLVPVSCFLIFSLTASALYRCPPGAHSSRSTREQRRFEY